MMDESVSVRAPTVDSNLEDGSTQFSSTTSSMLKLSEVANSDDEKIDSVPDGGLRAWLVVLGAWCGLFCSLGWLNGTITVLSIDNDSADVYRYWHFPELLPDHPASELLSKYNCLDPFIRNILHVCDGTY